MVFKVEKKIITFIFSVTNANSKQYYILVFKFTVIKTSNNKIENFKKSSLKAFGKSLEN